MGLISWVQAGGQRRVCDPVGLCPEWTSWAVPGGVKPPVPLQRPRLPASPRRCRKRSWCAGGGSWLSRGRCGAGGVELGWKVAASRPVQGSGQ